MNRRFFIAKMGKLGLTATTIGMTASVVEKGKNLMSHSGDEISSQLSALKKQLIRLEKEQKNYIKALCVVTALSTGIDLSILL